MRNDSSNNKKGGKRVAPRGSLPPPDGSHKAAGTHLQGARAAERPLVRREPAARPEEPAREGLCPEKGKAKAAPSAPAARKSAPVLREQIFTPDAPVRAAAQPERENPIAHAAQALHDGCERALDGGIALFRRLKKHLRILHRQLRIVVHEKRARHFPESNHRGIQLFLLAWGMLPMLGGKLRAQTWGMRKRMLNLYAHVSTRAERKRLHPVVFLGTAALIAAAAIFTSFYTFGTTVRYDGTPIASVGSKTAAVAALSDLEQVTAQTLGDSYTFDESLIQYSSGFVDRSAVVDGDTFEQELSSQIGLVSSAYALYVDGVLIGATPYEGALEELLQQIKNGCMTADTISCEINEKIEIRSEYVPAEKMLNLGYIAEILNDTKAGEVDYTVVSGDTWSEIAEKNNMTSVELLAMNPGYNINKIAIGEVLTISNAVPYLSVTLTERQRYVEDVPYEIEYQDSAYLYQGDYTILKKGVYGSADVVANVTTVNGEETQRDILSSVRLTNPVTEIQARGTKLRPTWVASGNFRWPCSGHITSRYGYRNLSYSRASKNHKGIDIANSRGTAVCAADGGTVSYAGWMGGYGYLVQINHGNGYTTYYGHNSSLLVSVGDHVYKGQQVARMGSTGNSTGNHCHFEIRYKGATKNPMQYLP